MLIKFSFLPGVIVNGLINVSISTIERRFDLKTSQFAPVASAYDFASFCVLIPLTYFGGRATASKPRWIGFGVLLMAIGSLVFALPHFLAGNYKAVSGELDVCQGTATGGGGGQDATGNSTLVGSDFQESHQRRLWALSNKYVTKVTNGRFFHFFFISIQDHQRHGSTAAEDYSWTVWLFVLAQLFHGAGAAPLFTLGVTYIDENVSKKMSSIYLGKEGKGLVWRLLSRC